MWSTQNWPVVCSVLSAHLWDRFGGEAVQYSLMSSDTRNYLKILQKAMASLLCFSLALKALTIRSVATHGIDSDYSVLDMDGTHFLGWKSSFHPLGQ